jgi:hypothetical protein
VAHHPKGPVAFTVFEGTMKLNEFRYIHPTDLRKILADECGPIDIITRSGLDGLKIIELPFPHCACYRVSDKVPEEYNHRAFGILKAETDDWCKRKFYGCNSQEADWQEKERSEAN